MLRLMVLTAIAFFTAADVVRAADPAQPQTRPSNVPLPALAHSSVSIPWEDLRSLLERNFAGTERPPVDFAFTSAGYEATVGDNGVSISASIELTLLVDNWVLVPAGPAGSGVVGATVDGKTAPLVVHGEGVFVLVKGEGQRKLALTIARETAVDSGVSRFDLPLVPAPLVTLSATIPQVGIAVRAPGAAAVSVIQNARSTAFKATYRSAAAAVLTWRPKPPPAKVLATTMTRVAVERGALRCSCEIDYEILHAGVDSFRVALPDGVEVTTVTGAGIRDSQTDVDGQHRALAVELKEPAEQSYRLSIEYVARFDAAKNASPAVPLVANPGVAEEHGFVGIEVRDSVEVIPAAAPAAAGVPSLQRIDVKELPGTMWDRARSPLLFGYRYDAPGAALTLSLTRNADVDVLVAMSDICEAATTYTPDGKSITKMMFVTRNNLKQYMTLKMPEGAQLWSAFVDDHPVTPARNAKGDILIPLKKSEQEDGDDDDAQDGKSYRARRERRRSEGLEGDRVHRLRNRVRKSRSDDDDAAPDLKPYDVEIVFVMPPVKFAEHGQLRPALPQSDVPVGHLAWAVFLPSRIRVVAVEGNAGEVSRFTLPFLHFGDEAVERMDRSKQDKVQQAMAQAEQMEKAQQLAEHSKAQGVLPVRIEIPMIGEIHRYEKFLTVEEAPALALSYSRRAE